MGFLRGFTRILYRGRLSSVRKDIFLVEISVFRFIGVFFGRIRFISSLVRVGLEGKLYIEEVFVGG